MTSRQAIRLRTQPKCRCHGNKGRSHNILYGSIESAIPENPLVGPNISGLSAIELKTDLQAILCRILGSKFLGLGGLNQKSKNNVLQSATWRSDSEKWLDSLEKQKRRIDLKERVRQRQRQKNNRLLGQARSQKCEQILSVLIWRRLLNTDSTADHESRTLKAILSA